MSPSIPTTSLTLTASVFSSGSPTGTITFYANGTQIGREGTARPADGMTLIATRFLAAEDFLAIGSIALGQHLGDGRFHLLGRELGWAGA